MNMNTQTWLNVPYRDKDQAKKLGAKYCPMNKRWYIPENITDVKKCELLSKWKVNVDKPKLINGTMGITELIKTLKDYYLDDNEFKKIIPIDLVLKRISSAPKIIGNICDNNPRVIGVICDYLIRRVICEIKGLPFHDSFADLYCKNAYFKMEQDDDDELPRFITLQEHEISHEDKIIIDAYSICKNMDNKTIDIILSVAYISLTHFHGQHMQYLGEISEIIGTCDELKSFVKQLLTFENIQTAKVSDIMLDSTITKPMHCASDCIIADRIIDFKVSRTPFTIEWSLQLITYAAERDTKLNKISINTGQIWNFYTGEVYEIDLSSWSLESRIKYITFLSKDSPFSAVSVPLVGKPCSTSFSVVAAKTPIHIDNKASAENKREKYDKNDWVSEEYKGKYTNLSEEERFRQIKEQYIIDSEMKKLSIHSLEKVASY